MKKETFCFCSKNGTIQTELKKEILCYVRVNYKVFRWSFRNAVDKKKNWCFRIMTKFRECNLELYTDLENILHKNVVTQLSRRLFIRSRL